MSEKTSGKKHNYAIVDQSGKPMEIPEEGSLGLLALGAVGVKAWREKRDSQQGKQQGSGGK